jgi:hypothetical protein
MLCVQLKRQTPDSSVINRAWYGSANYQGHENRWVLNSNLKLQTVPHMQHSNFCLFKCLVRAQTLSVDISAASPVLLLAVGNTDHVRLLLVTDEDKPTSQWTECWRSPIVVTRSYEHSWNRTQIDATVRVSNTGHLPYSKHRPLVELRKASYFAVAKATFRTSWRWRKVNKLLENLPVYLLQTAMQERQSGYQYSCILMSRYIMQLFWRQHVR